MASPLLLKIKYYDTNKVPADQARIIRQKNAAHANYIATRPGADKGEPEIGDNDFSDESGSNASYAQYIDERPNSHGLFGQDEKTPDLDSIKEELRNHNGIVWRMVISLKEEDAVKFGYTSRQAWENTLRATFPEAVKAIGIRESNLRWFAAYHAEMGHPHVHVMFWEKSPERAAGLLGKGETKEMKRILLREIYASERNTLLAEKTALRDLLRSMAKDSLQKEVEIINDIKELKKHVEALDGLQEGVAPKLWESREKELSDMLIKLSQIMPGKGRVALAYMPPEVKKLARDAADRILKMPVFSKELEAYINAAKSIASHYSSQENAIKEAEKRAYEDLRDRIAQDVLKNSKQLQSILRDIEKTYINDPENVDHPAYEHIHGVISSLIPNDQYDTVNRLYKSILNLYERELYKISNEFEVSNYTVLDIDFKKRVLEDLKNTAEAIKDHTGRVYYTYLDEFKHNVNLFTQKLLNDGKIVYIEEKIKNLLGPDKAETYIQSIRQKAADIYLKYAGELIPKEKIALSMELHEGRAANAVNILQNANSFYITNRPEEQEFTVRTMYRAYVSLGIEEDKAFSIACEWGEAAGIKDASVYVLKEFERMEQLKEIYKNTGTVMLNFVSTKDWDRLRDNLGYAEEELPKPWIGVIDKEKQAELDAESDKPVNEKSNITVELIPENIPKVVEAFTAAVNMNLSGEEIPWTIKTMNNVLYAMGVDKRIRENIIRDFFNKSNINIPEQQYIDIFHRSDIAGDKNYWIGHDKWERLMHNLNIQVDKPWLIKGEQNIVGILVKDLWKSAWKTLEREKAKSLAKAAIQNLKLSYLQQQKRRGIQLDIDIDKER